MTKLGFETAIWGAEARLVTRAVGGTARFGARMWAYSAIRNAGRRGAQDQPVPRPQRPAPHTARTRRAQLRRVESMTGSFR